MNVILILAAIMAATPAVAEEKPFWEWFGHQDNSTTIEETSDQDIDLKTPDNRAAASASHTGEGVNHATVSSSPNASAASANSSGMATSSGGGTATSSSTSTAHAGSMQ